MFGKRATKKNRDNNWDQKIFDTLFSSGGISFGSWKELLPRPLRLLSKHSALSNSDGIFMPMKSSYAFSRFPAPGIKSIRTFIDRNHFSQGTKWFSCPKIIKCLEETPRRCLMGSAMAKGAKGAKVVPQRPSVWPLLLVLAQAQNIWRCFLNKMGKKNCKFFSKK